MKRKDFIRTSALSMGMLTVAPGVLGNTKKSPNMNRANNFPAYKRCMDEGNSRALLGGGALLSLLATSQDTNGLYAMFEARGIPGFEPPPHTHTHEDETYYILEGKCYFKVGEEEMNASEGDFIFLPRGVKHEFKVLSDTFHCQVGIFPAGLDDYFLQLSKPHSSLEIPPLDTTPPPPEMMEEIAKLNENFGIIQ